MRSVHNILQFIWFKSIVFVFLVKKRRNWHRHDYSEIDDGSKVMVTLKLTELTFA